ncbi:hypothetical protein [Clostridium sp.]|uniref:hypothetical protein n=1 Tax=Clostridium sp. TaxID=1506 RepID=UPI002913F321|nr:hypothetical protein [Clostridium sp.]MDU7240420.1 hypothetical protein [Clostridium sp.]
MYKWKFPSRDYAATEGFSDAGLAEFKGNPLQALAREICQNSLDAADGTGRPVRVEFHKAFMKIDKFPGMDSLKDVIDSCQEFWGQEGDSNTKSFLARAKRDLNEKKFFVLRISDFNTKGVQGAFSENNITPWGSLVKGNAFSVKSDEKNAAGSFGIGKAAPFVSSSFQTVFYRTFDKDNVKAALGVSRLMAHKISLSQCKEAEDPVRRSVGYYGEDKYNKPAKFIVELDEIYQRVEHGTDLFIPGFCYSTSDEEWIKKILVEIVDNFLYSIYSGKLEVVVNSRKLNKSNLSDMLDYLGNAAKNAKIFYEVIREDNKEVIEITKQFHNLGSLRLKLLYKNDLNKNILVVRNSGMKIAKIPSLPRGISYTGFFELQSDGLNEFFRGMENPKHNAWEPKRHSDPKKASKYKEEVEDWIKQTINEKLIEISGEESIIDVGNCFNYGESGNKNKDERKKELIIDTVKSIKIIEEEPQKKKFKVSDIGGNIGQNGNSRKAGTIDDKGGKIGHRHRSGTHSSASPTGRRGSENSSGIDQIYTGKREVYVSARIISRGNGMNKLIFTTEENIELCEIEIVTRGENGNTLQLYVQEVNGINVTTKDGHIVVSNIVAKTKQTVEFKIAGKRNYAMGVKAYGN